MKSDHRIVVSKVLWEQRKFWVLSKGQDDKLKICKVQGWEIPFSQSPKKIIMISSFDRNNLGEESFALWKEIHRDKRKKGIMTIAESILRKEF